MSITITHCRNFPPIVRAERLISSVVYKTDGGWWCIVLCVLLCCAEGGIISSSCLSHPSLWTGWFDWQLRLLTLVLLKVGLYEDIYPEAIKFQDMQSLDLMHHQKGLRSSLQKSRDLFQIDTFYFIHFKIVWNWYTSEGTEILTQSFFFLVSTFRHTGAW